MATEWREEQRGRVYPCHYQSTPSLISWATIPPPDGCDPSSYLKAWCAWQGWRALAWVDRRWNHLSTNISQSIWPGKYCSPRYFVFTNETATLERIDGCLCVKDFRLQRERVFCRRHIMRRFKHKVHTKIRSYNVSKPPTLVWPSTSALRLLWYVSFICRFKLWSRRSTINAVDFTCCLSWIRRSVKPPRTYPQITRLRCVRLAQRLSWTRLRIRHMWYIASIWEQWERMDTWYWEW